MKRRKKRAKRRRIPATKEVRQILERQRERFREKFGREPGPDDPIFFDPDEAEPRPFEFDPTDTAIVKAMEAAGIDPALIYAYRRTGLLVSQGNLHLLSDKDLAEWQAALEEYEALRARRN